MARYIDADAAKDSFCGVCSIKKRYEKLSEMCRDYKDLHGNGCSMMRLIDETPTADVVEVVRCRDCKHYTHIIGRGDKALYECSYMGRDVALDAFCSYGERRGTDVR